MSHVTVMEGIVINDLAALKAACQELIRGGLNAELVQDRKPRVHGRDAAPTCEYVLKLKDSDYDVGFQKQADGTYKPVFDIYQNHVGRQVGIGSDVVCELPNDYYQSASLRQLGKLSQLYAQHAAMNLAANEGYSVENITRDDQGNLVLLLNA